jgi:pyruvate dehydrogenase E2 component (dihydrolipoamide acetyltransferase)
MATEIFIHKMTEHMETARIIRWLVKEGDAVAQNQIIMEVETDKAAVDLEAPAAGVIKSIRPDAVDGAEVKVGETIAYIARADESVPSFWENEDQSVEKDGTALLAGPVSSQARIEETIDPVGAVRATPLSRKLARDLGVDLSLVRGTGPRGIIRDEDVRGFATKALSPAAERPAESVDSKLVELNSVQALTGQRMLQSVQTAPQFSLTLEADMTNTLWVQQALADKILLEAGEKISLTALMVKVCAEALKSHPYANASFDNGKVRLHRAINVGVAVGSEHGLVVPVILDADHCSLAKVVQQLHAFSKKAEVMRFAVEDLQAGTFTLSNLGMYGVLQFNAILNPPQSAILAAGKVVKRTVELEDGRIGLRPIINLTLTVDHRVMDGLKAALFLGELKQRLEKPYFLL